MGASAFRCQPAFVAIVTLAAPLAPTATLGSTFLISYSLSSARAVEASTAVAANRAKVKRVMGFFLIRGAGSVAGWTPRGHAPCGSSRLLPKCVSVIS